MSTPLIPGNLLKLSADTVRVLSAEAVQRANSGHPGMPMGMAELAVTLWLRYLVFNPNDPQWIGRDRFVLSNGHGSTLLYTMLHLSGYALSVEDLKQFRQWESKTPGHPESFITPGVETTTGPLGQGVANAVGLAVAQALMSERYADEEFNPFAHRVFCFCGDGCLMEGVSGEASSLAGHLGLGNLVLVYDDNEISIAGHTDLAFTEDVGKRYEAYGWRVINIEGHDFEQIDTAFDQALQPSDQPTIIVANTIIGKGSPNKAGTAGIHGSPLGEDELALTKKGLGWSESDPFAVPEQVTELFAGRKDQLDAQYEDWQSKFARWEGENTGGAAALRSQLALELPEDLEASLIAALPGGDKPAATRKISQAVLQAAAAKVPGLIGGSADLEPSTLTLIKDSSDVQKGAFGGRNLRFGVREHAMGSVMNGLAYYGGFIPYGSTFLCFLDYMRPAVRLAALSRLPGLFIYTHDSIFLGEDGPTHQPIEHLAMMRATPNLHVYRPADGLETAVCYSLAISRKNGPSALIFTRQNVQTLARPDGIGSDDIARGGYPVLESEGKPEIVFVATGSEVELAVASAKILGQGRARVVSMPCVERYLEQSKEYRQALIPSEAKKAVVEAGTSFGWPGVLGSAEEDTLCITIDGFGASAPYDVLVEKFGFTPEQIVERVGEKFGVV